MNRALLCLAPLCALMPGDDPLPEWIWSSSRPGADETIWTSHQVEIRAAVKKATLKGSCDNSCEVFLDGKQVLRGTEWQRPFSVDVSGRLQQGVANLAAWGRNEGGPAGLWLELQVQYEDGEKQVLVTDSTWLVSTRETDGWQSADGSRDGWKPAVSLGELGCDPWGTPTKAPQATHTEALDPSELTLPEGFAAERLYSVPKGQQGSWVSMTFDPDGRLITSDQYGSLYRMTPPPTGEVLQAEDVHRLAVDLGRAHGLLYAFDSLYVVVAEGKDRGLYRLRDLDGDDQYESVEMLEPLDGGGEHGPHAVILSPDERSLYIVGGNHTQLPAGITRSRPSRVWGEDQLLPRRPDPNGHAAGRMAPGGWVCRTDPAGEEWELVSIGMRNAYDIAFNPVGELFTFDSDMEWDVGLPWYRPTRILHLVSGADYGWRNGSGKWPAHYPDSLPSVADLGLSSPTGVLFGTQTSFHGPYRRALFAADWSYGTVYAVHLQEDGASYTGTAEPFVTGKPFQVTDLAVGPDGAMYITTGGRRTQSGLFRIRSEQKPAPRPAAEVAGGNLALRRVIERNHGLGTASPYWSELGHADHFVAHAARTALEQSDVQHWAEKALAEDDPHIALQAMIGLARAAPQEYGERILERVEEMPFEEWSNEDLMPWLRLMSLAFVRSGAPDEARALGLGTRLEVLFPSGQGELDRELCRVLVYLGAASVAEQAVLLMEEAEDPVDQIYYAFTLRTLDHGWTLPLRRRYFKWLNEQAPRLSGGHSLTKYLAGIRADAVQCLPDELRSWQDLLKKPVVQPGAQLIEAAAVRFVRAWTMEELAADLDAVKRGRNHARGARAFKRATCFECHRIGGQGGSTGPDLTGAGSRFNTTDLLESILLPSKAISDQYQEIEIQTEDEELFVGRVESEDDEVVVLRTLPPAEESIEIFKDEIALRRPHPISRMPAGLLDTMNRQEILDLLAYCLAGADPEDAAFKK